MAFHPIRKRGIRKAKEKGGEHTDFLGATYETEMPHGDKKVVSKQNLFRKKLIGEKTFYYADTGERVGGRQLPKTWEILRRLRISLNLLGRKEIAEMWGKAEYHRGTFAGKEGVCRIIDGQKEGEKILKVKWNFGITRHYNRQGEPVII